MNLQIHKRRALAVALAGRKYDTIRPITMFLLRNLFLPNYFPMLSVVAETLFGSFLGNLLFF